MLKEEFEKLTGKEVTWETYQKWNECYMDCDLTKQEFCKKVKSMVHEKQSPKHYIWGIEKWGGRDMVYHLMEVQNLKFNVKTGKESFELVEVGKTMYWVESENKTGFTFSDYNRMPHFDYNLWKQHGIFQGRLFY